MRLICGSNATINSVREVDPSDVDKTRGVGCPRDPCIDFAILSATAELLVESGYSNLSLAAVVKRASITKSTLYRRWWSKA
uniref:HTH tetR-type domain-containing protein n=1 Tax=Mycobacterium leprae TaxID=1769 RepID=O32899_MYCLR|nr:hypothetical protein MCB1779.39c [Mycobacterium leprae]